MKFLRFKRTIAMALAVLMVMGGVDSSVYASTSKEGEQVDVITGFSEFDIEEHALHFSGEEKPPLETVLAQMPEQLEVYVNGSPESVWVDVEWSHISDEYEVTDAYYYQFSPSWDEEKYVLSDDIDLFTDAPYIAVYVEIVENGPAAYTVTNAEYEPLIYEYLTKTLGYKTSVACGIMANIYCESSFIPTNLQNSYEKKLGYTDVSYTEAVDKYIAGATSGAYTNFVRDSAGYGLCQWTYWSLKEELLNYAIEKGTSIGDYKMQLDLLKTQLKQYKKVYSAITSAENTADSAYDVGYMFCYGFERPANYETKSIERGNLARDKYWAEYGNDTSGFQDIDSERYYYDAVLWAVENEITTGKSDTLFDPDGTCTRAQAVTFLWRIFGKPEAADVECVFEDIDENAYYYNAVLWAIEKGITEGTSATQFSPDEELTRAQFVTFLWRMEQGLKAECVNIFEDVHEDAYYYDAVLWAVENGITEGTGDSQFSPDQGCTRAQVVTFLYRAYGN